MTKSKSTKRALLVSMISLVLCCAMLVGTTFAWFTDTVTTGVNKIVAGNLDIEVSYKDEDEWKSIEGADSLFDKNALWEPGHTEYVTLKIENKGTLALNYKLVVSPVLESAGINVNGVSFKLSDYLVFGTTEASGTETTYDRTSAREAAGTTMGLNQGGLTKASYMEAGANAQYITLVVYMPEDVGNDANYKTGTVAPFIELGVTVVATQRQSEKDSFGDDYDAKADLTPDNEGLDELKYIYSKPTYASGSITNNNGSYESSGSGIAVDNDTVTITSDGTSVTIPTSALDGEETTNEVRLEVTETLAPDGFVLESETLADHYDVTATINGEELALLTENDSYYTVTLSVVAGLQEVKLYHDGVLLPNAKPADGGEYYTYDSATGKVTAYVKHFSPFSVTYKAVAELDGKYYGTLEAAVAACTTSSQTVNLLCDVTVSQHYTAANYWNLATAYLYGTLDGNDHTITLPEEVCFCYLMDSNSCIKDVTFIANDASAAVYAYNAAFDGVTVGGSIKVYNNTGAFVIYGWPRNSGTLAFKNCNMAATMSGPGADSNYNAAFIGYGLGSSSDTVNFTFEDCKITGSLSCGAAALFLGNDSQLQGVWNVNITNFIADEGAKIRSTLTDGTRAFNGIVAANGAYGTPTVNIDGTSYTGKEGFASLVDGKNAKWPGLFEYGPSDQALALVKNSDGTFTITPAETEGVTKYVVSMTIYATYKAGGTFVQSVSETIESTEVTQYTTSLKDLQFVDQEWVDANSDAKQGTLAGNTIYTKEGTSYYILTNTELATLNGTPKSAQIYSVTAYNEAGEIVASASLTES